MGDVSLGRVALLGKEVSTLEAALNDAAELGLLVAI
jgi:hypothetical protein